MNGKLEEKVMQFLQNISPYVQILIVRSNEVDGEKQTAADPTEVKSMSIEESKAETIKVKSPQIETTRDEVEEEMDISYEHLHLQNPEDIYDMII